MKSAKFVRRIFGAIVMTITLIVFLSLSLLWLFFDGGRSVSWIGKASAAVLIQVVDRAKNEPIKDVRITLYNMSYAGSPAYMLSTNESGAARFSCDFFATGNSRNTWISLVGWKLRTHIDSYKDVDVELMKLAGMKSLKVDDREAQKERSINVTVFLDQ